MVIDFSSSLYHSKYRPYRLYAEILSDRVLEHEDTIRSILNLPDKIHIRLRPLRYNYGIARYIIEDTHSICSIELDVKQELRMFDNTLIHELIHAEQYHENRLTLTEDQTWFKWKGEEVSKKYQNYTDLPWEAEAYSRAEMLAPIVFNYK
jgi:hypothetical protein